MAKRALRGLTLVTVGGILLANTTGVLPWSVWWTIVLLWPLLLVAVGIDILGRALNSTVLRVLASVVVIAGLLFGALSGSGRIQAPVFRASGTARPFSFSEAGTATSGRAQISAGLAEVELRGRPERLVTVSGETPFGAPRVTASVNDSTADVRVSTGEPRGVTVAVPGVARTRLAVALDSNVAWSSVKIDAGVSNAELDLRELDVAQFQANLGLSSATITFGDLTVPGGRQVPVKVAKISGGLSSFKLRVPRALGVELVFDNGLGSVNVPQGWTRSTGGGAFQGTWRSDGYDSSASKLRIEVKTGLSGVDVERY